MKAQIDTEKEILTESRKAQIFASDPAKSVWVEASAGSGKTRVLIDRIFRLLLDGVDLRRILCITYTKAASAEISNRLITRSRHWLMLDDQGLLDEYMQLSLLDEADIAEDFVIKTRKRLAMWLDNTSRLRVYTFHAFCESILKRFPIEAGIPPKSETTEGTEQAMLVRRATINVLSKINRLGKLDNGAEKAGLNDLIQDLGEKGSLKLISNIVDERHRIFEAFEIKQTMSKTAKEKSLKKIKSSLANILGIDSIDAIAPKNIISDFFDQACSDEAKNSQLNWQKEVKDRHIIKQLELWLDGDYKSSIEASVKLANKTGKWFDCLEVTEKAIEKFYNIFFTGDKLRSKIKKADPYADESENNKGGKPSDIIYTEMHEVADNLDDIKDNLQSYLLYYRNNQAILLALEVIEEYQKIKNERATFDFRDLIIETLKLMTITDIAMPWILYKIDGGFDHILMDEAQDTSPEQWAIFEKLIEEICSRKGARKEKRTVFIVGDFKQSIYSFQGADPKRFRAAKSKIASLLKDGGQKLETQSLAVSYRSGQEILDFVDDIFKSNPAIMGLNDGEWLNHKAAFPSSDCKCFMENIEVTSNASTNKRDFGSAFVHEESAETSPKAIEQFTAKIADNIKKMPNYGDIMILIRKRRPLLTSLVRQLRNRKIPVFEPDRLLLNEHIAVRDIINVLHFCAFPENDLCLASVLRSPLVELDDNELFSILQERESDPLFDFLKQKSAKKAGKIKEICKWLDELRVFAYSNSSLSLLHRILYLPCPASKVNGFKAMLNRLGEDARDPLETLEQKIEDYEIKSGLSLEKILEIFEIPDNNEEIKREINPQKDSLKKNSPEEEEQKAVRIITTHGAKGLESPVVIIPDLDDSISDTANREQFLPLWHNNIPIYAAKKANQSSAFTTLTDKIKNDRKEENLRLLYVAITRAKKEVYIYRQKTLKASTTAKDSWSNIIEEELRNNRSDQDQSSIKKAEKTTLTPAAAPITTKSTVKSAKANKTAEKSNKFLALLRQAAVPETETLSLAESVTSLVEKMANEIKDDYLPNAKGTKEAITKEAITKETITKEEFALNAKKAHNARVKGKAIHYIIQHISELDLLKHRDNSAKFSKIVKTFLENYSYYLATPSPDDLPAQIEAQIEAQEGYKNNQLSPNQIKEITEEIMNTIKIPELKSIFSPSQKTTIRSESAVAGFISSDNSAINGVIDMWALDSEKIWAVDFKSGSSKGLGHIKAHLQMALYANLLSQQHPRHKHIFGIVWTKDGRFERLKHQYLETYLAKTSINEASK